jgi:methionyl-tRNA formyltransferase
VFSAVVFAYSEVGVRCLGVLLDHGARIPLVVTHADNPLEKAWFGSVAKLAAEHNIDVAIPHDPNKPDFVHRVAHLSPDYIFSFYYRSLLSPELLACARWGALNMHGSLLPNYRGRACINWAILRGETETGATLHYMVAKPDAGAIVAQERVDIGIDDDALAVSQAVAAAAARLLVRTLPALAAGPPPGRPMELAQGSYFGGRKPEDGRIDWSSPARAVHGLIRAVAPPFPGAFTDLPEGRLLFEGSKWCNEKNAHPHRAPCLYTQGESFYLDCSDGWRLRITALRLNEQALDARGFRRLYGDAPLGLAATTLRSWSRDVHR